MRKKKCFLCCLKCEKKNIEAFNYLGQGMMFYRDVVHAKEIGPKGKNFLDPRIARAKMMEATVTV